MTQPTLRSILASRSIGAPASSGHWQHVGVGTMNARSQGNRFCGADLKQHGFDLAYFAATTKVLTQRGEVAVGDLSDADQVFTLDNGLRPLAHKIEVTIENPDQTAPICIAKGALKNRRELLVSPNHNVLIRDWQAELLFGDNEVLIPAKNLINDGSIAQMSVDVVEYVGLVFMEHQIVLAEGIPCETLDIAAVGQAKGPMATALPHLRIHPKHKNETARRLLHPHEADLLIQTMKVGQSLPSWAA